MQTIHFFERDDRLTCIYISETYNLFCYQLANDNVRTVFFIQLNCLKENNTQNTSTRSGF